MDCGFIRVTSSPEVITRYYSSILSHFVDMEQRAFGIGAHSFFG